MKPHPAIVAFPIALFCAAALLALVSIFAKREQFKQIIFWNLLLGLIGGVAAITTGLIEEATLVHDDAIHELLIKHQYNGFIIASVFSVLFVWLAFRKNKMLNKEYTIWCICILMSTSLLFYQAFLGGKMVYGHGAGVKPMEEHLQENTGHHHHH